MNDCVTLCAVSMTSQPGRTSENLGRIRRAAERAVAAGAELVLFPELSLTGFLPNHPEDSHDIWLRKALREARRLAEPLDGPAVAQLTHIARNRRLLLCAGLLEDAGRQLFNTQVLVGPDGLLGSWRKLHVPMYEMPFYAGGRQAAAVDTPLGRIGVNICFDTFFPESTRLLADTGAEIVLFPFAADPDPGTASAWFEWASVALRARCQENGIFGLACNLVGPVEACGVRQTFPGGQAFIGPMGNILHRPDDTGGDLLTVTCRAEDLRMAWASPDCLCRFYRPELHAGRAGEAGAAERADAGAAAGRICRCHPEDD